MDSNDRSRFIYGRIAAELLFHEKTMELAEEPGGEGAVAVYVFAIVLSRFKKTDGVLTKPEVRSLLCGKGAKHYARLVKIGWLIEREDGRVDVWNYSKFNETNDQIEASKAAVRKRVQDSRSRARKGLQAEGVTRYKDVTDATSNACVPSSSSLSDLGDQDPSREGGVQRGDPPDPVEARYVPVVGTPDDITLTPDLIASIEIAGAPTPTPEHVAAFLANARAKGKVYVDWLAAFRFWMLREKNFASSTRVRSARGAIEMQPLAPARAPSAFGAAEALREGEETKKRMARGEF